MPTQSLPFGPFASLWIGDSFSTLPNLPFSDGIIATAPLVSIEADTTGGQFLKYSYPTEWCPSKKEHKRTGGFQIEFDLVFMGADDQISKIAMGNSLAVSDIDIPSTKPNLFCIFCQDFDPLSNNNWLIPIAQPIVESGNNKEKTALTRTPVKFHYQVDRPSADTLFPYYRGTLAKLKAIDDFGSRIPV